MNQIILKELQNISKNVKINEPMLNHTSFKVGGFADLFITPKSIDELVKVYKFLKRENIHIFIMGKGTNILVSDNGIRGAVIKISDNLSNFCVKENVIEAEAGIELSILSKAASEKSLSGLEFSCGIPGTLGGAVIMNAGAYGGEIKDILINTTYMNENGEIEEILLEGHKFKYRSSTLQDKKGIVLKSKLKLFKEDKEKIEKTMEELTYLRRMKQPLDRPSAGSVFKRPEGYYAGKLIEDSNLKGFQIGDAQVSTLHCGFIINRGKASSNDIINLINHIKGTVHNKFGVNLETEVKIVGDFSSTY